uniref:maleylacetoacetate isomerase n=1 Tax=Brachionus rotundiformis TaxID=96890 RepID=A0A3G2JSF6_9BILA|nr:glutathione S-transferase Z1 [Brachionus rotundiformis]
MSFNKPILWNFYRGASWRVRLALAFKKIDYEYRSVNIDKGEQFTKEYEAINPNNEIPTLQIDGYNLTQTMPIIEYLDETRSFEPKLLPSDSYKRCKARSIAEIINSGMQPYQKIVKRLGKELGEQEKTKRLELSTKKALKAIESIVAETSGKYCIGDGITIADIFLVPAVHTARLQEINLNEYPCLSKIIDNLDKLPEVNQTHPKNQVDYQQS